MMWKVTLKRAPKYPDRTWEHDLRWTAQRRVNALCDLHSAKYVVDVENQHFIVDATYYYNHGR